jgi:hypothetical protein
VRGFRAHPLVDLPCRQTLTRPLSLCPLPLPSLALARPSLPPGGEKGEATYAPAVSPTPQRPELTIDQHYPCPTQGRFRY